MYRIKYRYRRVSGAGVVYGATCFNAAKSAFITDTNYINGDIGSSHYVVGGAAPALSWVTGVAYFKGRSAGASSGAGTLTNPKTFANKAAFFTPVLSAIMQLKQAKWILITSILKMQTILLNLRVLKLHIPRM